MSEILESVLDIYANRPTTAILMSGVGSNARALLSDEATRHRYNIQLICSDRPTSNARAIGDEFGLDSVIEPAGAFASPDARAEYFRDLSGVFRRHRIQAALYAGFLKITTPEFCHEFPGVNVHPADLTITDVDGIAKYRGMHALHDMRDDTGQMAASFHVVDTPVDTGSVIAVSRALDCPPGLNDFECHQLLKTHEHELYLATLATLAGGQLDTTELPLRMP
jgi:folate-dependent phosphoribosylglycinamide formyltransferase PurN